MFGSFLPSLWSSSNRSLLEFKEPTSLCNHLKLHFRSWSDRWRQSCWEARDSRADALAADNRHPSYSARFELPLVHRHLPALYDDFDIQPVPVTFHGITLLQNDVGQLARLKSPDLIAHTEVIRSVGTHQLDDVLHREHHVVGSQLVLEA